MRKQALRGADAVPGPVSHGYRDASVSAEPNCPGFPIALRPRNCNDPWVAAVLEAAPEPPTEVAMMNIVYFDVETQKSAADVGGWHNARDMRISVGVTYSTHRGGYRVYSEKQVDDLLEELQRADRVVGFNILRFDYEVLHGYTIFDLRQVPTLDLMVELQKLVNHRLSLDAVASATFGADKTADGLQAIRWFREGHLLEIAEYCCYDVKLTKLVHEFGMKHKRLFYQNRFGVTLPIPVGW